MFTTGTEFSKTLKLDMFTMESTKIIVLRDTGILRILTMMSMMANLKITKKMEKEFTRVQKPEEFIGHFIKIIKE